MSKMISRLVLGVTCLCAIACSTASADAAILYRVRFDQENVLVNAGQTVTLNVFFDEEVTGGDVHVLGSVFNGTDPVGLVAGNVGITASGPGVSTITGAAQNDTDFDLGGATLGNPTIINNGTLFNNPAGGTLSGSVRSVALGSIFVTAAGPVGSATTFQLSDADFGAAANDLIIDNGFGDINTILDTASNLTYGSSVVTIDGITGVPEPSSMAVLALITGAGAGVSRWKKRRKAVEAATAV